MGRGGGGRSGRARGNVVEGKVKWRVGRRGRTGGDEGRGGMRGGGGCGRGRDRGRKGWVGRSGREGMGGGGGTMRKKPTSAAMSGDEDISNTSLTSQKTTEGDENNADIKSDSNASVQADVPVDDMLGAAPQKVTSVRKGRPGRPGGNNRRPTKAKTTSSDNDFTIESSKVDTTTSAGPMISTTSPTD